MYSTRAQEAARPDTGTSAAAANSSGPVEWARLSWGFILMVLVMGLLACPRSTAAQEVRALASSDSVYVGERFRLALTAAHPRDANVQFPDPARGDTLLGDLVAIERLSIQGRTIDAQTRLDSALYEVTTFALDTAFAPPLPVRFVRNGDTTLVLSQPLVVPVRSVVPADAESIRDLAPLAEFPAPWWPWLVGGATLLLLGGAYYLWRRKRTAGYGEDAEPALPPFEEVQVRLRKLEESVEARTPRQVKPFYVELSDVVRRYLKRRTGLPALEQTTSELVQALHDQAGQGRFPDETPARLRRILSQADLVKFAEAHPPTEESRALLTETHTALQHIEDRMREAEREAARRQQERERQEA